MPIPLGAVCACGCAEAIPRRRANGSIRYVPVGQTVFYVHGHNPTGKGGPAHHLWKGGRIKRRGYVLLYLPGDPRADAKGYVLEHRVVWEEANGRALSVGEHVHHINGVPDDNRPENLIALTKHAHARQHNGGALPRWMASHRQEARERGKKGAAARWQRPV